MCRWVPVRFLNIPHKEYWITPERVQAVRKMIVWDVAVIFSMPLLALSFIPVNIALVGDAPGGVSAVWLIGPMGAWLIAMACYVIWMITRRYRPRPQEPR
jgi:energy-converting hydrogenase Eha subunit A